MLGAEFAAGNSVSYAKMKERMDNAVLKAEKITSMMKGGWLTMNLMKSHVISAVSYSARVNGIPNDIVDQTRIAIRAGTSPGLLVGLLSLI